jgi:Sporulation lipoprotein YhcN/YlaJ (Spore_YhcN_YlaJ)
MRKYLLLLVVLGVLTGCTNNADTNHTKQESISQPVKYKQSNEKKPYIQGDDDLSESEEREAPLNVTDNPSPQPKATSSGGDKQLQKQAEEIFYALKDMPGVSDVQTHVTEDVVNVALDTEDEFRGYPGLLEKVRAKVEPIAKGKKIKIYTDGAYFDRMRNLSSSPKGLMD